MSETLLDIITKRFIFRYLIHGAFISDLYIATLSTKFIPVEDAFTTGYELCIFLALIIMLIAKLTILTIVVLQ